MHDLPRLFIASLLFDVAVRSLYRVSSSSAPTMNNVLAPADRIADVCGYIAEVTFAQPPLMTVAIINGIFCFVTRSPRIVWRGVHTIST